MSFASIGGLATHYSFEPAGDGPPLVFINSLGTDLRLWDPLLSGIRNPSGLLRYDKRGHGLSDSPGGPYAIGDFVDDLHALTELLGLTELVLIGISIGGMIALEFAARNPRRTRALVLLDCLARIGTAEAWRQRREAAQRLGMRRIAPEVLKIWFSEQFADRQPAVWNGFRNMLSRTPAQGYAASCAALAEADLTDRLALVRCPALVLAGEHDQATPADQCRRLAESLTSARFELVDGAGHLPCVERPDQVAQQVTAFLEEHGYG